MSSKTEYNDIYSAKVRGSRYFATWRTQKFCFKSTSPCRYYDFMRVVLKIKIFAVCLLLSLFSLSYAGADVTEGYDENTEITVRGTVTEIVRRKRGPVVLKLKAGNKTYNAVTAPEWYLSQESIIFNAGSVLEVRGSKYFGKDGNLYIAVREIKDLEIEKVINLRDSNCKPMWKGHRMRNRQGQ
jgi:hypothetical protein